MKLKHPDSNQTIEVSKEAVPNYESQGWEPVKPEPKSSSK